MSFLFKHKTRTPAELVQQIKIDLKDIVHQLDTGSGEKLHKKLSFNAIKEAFKASKNSEVSTQKAAKHIGQLRKMLVGDENTDAKPSKSTASPEAAGAASQGNASRTKGNTGASTR